MSSGPRVIFILKDPADLVELQETFGKESCLVNLEEDTEVLVHCATFPPALKGISRRWLWAEHRAHYMRTRKGGSDAPRAEETV